MSSRVSIFDKDGSLLEDLIPISTSEKIITEDILQRIIFNQPELLSSVEIDPDYSRLVSLAREVSVKSGSIDLLLITPEGQFCVVETKLWRNTEAHRTVVAQILDYAKDLTKLSFNELVEKVTRKRGEEARKEFFRIVKQHGELDDVELQESIIQSLADGRFLLLIVGDTIRPNLLLLSESIQSAPHLQYKLALLELHLYEFQKEKVLVIPSLVGRTVEQTRAVVKIQYEEKKPMVEVTSIEPTKERTDKITYKEFVSSMPEGFADIFIPAYEEWVEQGYTIYLGNSAIIVRLDSEGKKKKVFEIYPYATHIYSKKYEENTKLPSNICQQYRDNVQKSSNLVRLLSSNRQYVQFKDLTLEDFALHMHETNNVIHKLADYFSHIRN